MTTPAGFPLADGPLIGSWPRMQLEVSWTSGGNSPLPANWYELTKRVRGSWKAALSGRQYELDTVQAGTMDFKLDNLDGALDPDNAAGPFYGHVLPYRRARLVMTTSPSQNLLYPWVASGTSVANMAASAGTLSTATGLSPSLSGLTTAHTWALPNGTASFATFGMTGATADWTVLDAEGTTATVGAPYAFGVDLQLAAGGMTSLSIRARLSWYGLTGTVLSTNVSSTVGITTAWTRLTATGTAPAGAAFAVVSISTQAATTAATTVRVTGWQLEQAAAATTWAAAGTRIHLWEGFVESWPATFEEGGKYGLVSPTFVDGLGPMSQLVLGDAMPQLVAEQSPQYFFDLAATTVSTDVGGAVAFPDLHAGSDAVLDITGANAATGVAISSATDIGTLWNTPGPVMSLLSNQAASLGDTSGATYLKPWTGTSSVMLPTSGGWSRMICFRTDVTPGTGGRYSAATLWLTSSPGFFSGTGDQAGAYCFINSSGQVGVNIKRSDGTSLFLANPNAQVCDGNWHCAIVTLSSDGKTIHVMVDGNNWQITGSLDMHATTYTRDSIGTGISDTGTVNKQPFNGDLAWFAQWSSELPQATTTDLTIGFALGWSGDAGGTRLARTLGLSGYGGGVWSAPTFLGSVVFLGGTSTSGQSPLDILQMTADTEVGQIVMDRDGIPTMYGHLWRWIQSSPVITFGEDTVSGEIPYNEDVSFVQDPTRLFNDVQITCDGASDATDATRVQIASDAASQTAYFPQSLTRTINPHTVASGRDIADYLLSQYKDPHTRLSTLTVDLHTSPARQAAVGALNFADLVRVRKRPALAPMKSLDCFIEQMEYSGDDTGKFQVALSMSPASQYDYWIISAAWAALTTSPASGVSVITVGPISGVSLIPAQYVIPAGYVMTLGYGTANVETVTVASVQTVVAGYSTVQLTLAAPTTKSHTTGDLICEPLPANASIPPAGPAYPKCYDAASLIGGTTPLIGF